MLSKYMTEAKPSNRYFKKLKLRNNNRKKSLAD